MRSSAPQAFGNQAFPVLKARSRHAQCALFPMRRGLSPCPVPVWCSRTREADVVSTVFPHHRNKCCPSGVPAPPRRCPSGVPAPLKLVERSFWIKALSSSRSKRRRRRSEHKEHVTKSTYVSIDQSFLALFSVFTLQPVHGEGGERSLSVSQ